MNELNNDGSIKNASFSEPGYTGGYPHPIRGDTYASYRARVDNLRPQGFHLGDLSWPDWDKYCRGSGSYEGQDATDFIDDY